MINIRHKFANLFAGLGLLASMAMTSYANGEEAIVLPVLLKSQVDVVDENILLSDVFDGVERYGDSVITKSPEPGQEILLPAVWLWRVAKLYRVNWQPTSKLDTSLVKRGSTLIHADYITQFVKEALFERTGEDDLVELEFNSIIKDLSISPKSEASIKINRLTYDENSNRFSIEIVAPAQGTPEVRTIINGNLHRLVEAAVPNKRIMPGEVIRSSDLDWKRMRARNVNNKAILDAAQIIGQSAKRTLIVGKLITLDSVEPPVLVKKKGLVTVSLTTNHMLITTQGMALQDGALDEVIQIRNLQSDIVIEALVTGLGQAVVINASELAMN